MRILTEAQMTDVKVPKLRSEDEKHYILHLRDVDQKILDLLKCIKGTANMGHSFDVVVDPDCDGGQKFYIDGDGTDHIYSISINDYED